MAEGFREPLAGLCARVRFAREGFAVGADDLPDGRSAGAFFAPTARRIFAVWAAAAFLVVWAFMWRRPRSSRQSE
jgi:hypothetical protein